VRVSGITGTKALCFVAPEIIAARALAEKIRRRGIGDDRYVTVREAYLKGWEGLVSAEAVRAAAGVLQKAEWIRAVAKAAGSSGGRPSERYEINPKVRNCV
jgi:putative DNA primase/helicase